jgi:hypothetical protein
MRRALFAVLPLITTVSAFAIVSGPEIPISDLVTGPRPGVRYGPRVATNGTDYVIVWDEVAELRATRVDRDGRVVDPSGIRVATGSGHVFAVASDGRDYVIAYNCTPGDQWFGAPHPSVCLTRLDATTGRVEQGARIKDAVNPVIAAVRGRYQLAYQTPYTLDSESLFRTSHAIPGTV